MTAGEASCHCQVCGVVCEGQFNGCATVWANGPRQVMLTAPDAGRLRGVSAAPAGGVVVEELPEDPPLVRTAWPATAGAGIAEPLLPTTVEASNGSGAPEGPVSSGPPAAQLQSQPTAPARDQDEESGASTRSPAAPEPSQLHPEPQPSVPARGEDERTQVFEWLQDSFDGVRSQLRVLSDALNRQQQTLDSLADAKAAADRVSQLADVLPDRIGEVIHEAVATGRLEPETLAEERDRQAVVDLRDSTQADARPNGASARPVDSSPSPASPEPAPDAPVSSRPSAGQPPGVRTQLTALASNVQDRINRSNWQQTLRSLRPSAHWPPEGR